MPEMTETACAFCGNTFVPSSPRALYCSKECNKRAWTARRSAERAARRKSAIRICEHCGKPFEWSSANALKRFCSAECKRRAETAVRSVSRTRADLVSVKPADAPPAALDALRGGKGDDYFRVLFSLPEADQYAEMAMWTEGDHAAAAAYLGVCGDSDGSDDYAADESDIAIPVAPPAAFDEEDHFGQ